MVPTSCRTSHGYQSSGQAVDPKNTSRAFQVSEFQVPDAAQIGGNVGLNNGSNQGYSNSYVTMNVDAPIFSNNFLDSADNFTSVSSLQNNVLHSQNLNSFTQADARHMIAASGMPRGNAFGDGMQSVSTRENSCYQTNPTYMAGSQQQYLGRQSTQSYENMSRNMGTVMDGKNLQHFISSATLGNRSFNNLMEFSDSNNHSLNNLASVDTGGLYNSNLYSNCLQGTSQIHSMQGPAYFGYLPTQQDGYATSGGSGLAAPISLCQKTSVFSLPGTFHDVDAATNARFSKKVTEGHNAQDLDTLIQPKQNQKQHIGLDTSGFPNMPLNLQLLQNTQGMAFSPRLCQHEQHMSVFGNGVSDCLSGSLDLQQNQSLTYSNGIQEPKLCGQERFSLPESNQQKHMKDSLVQNNQMFCENLYDLQNGNGFQPQNTHSLSTSGTKPCHSNPKYNEQSPRISFQGPQESQSIESSLTHYASNSLHDQQSKDDGMQEIVANEIVGPQCSVLADASVDQGTATVIQTRSSDTSVDAMKDCQTDVRRKLYENSISFLVLLYHVTFCKAAGRECPEYKAKCSSVRKLGEHILSCKKKPCSRVQGCQQLTNLVKHHIQCRDHTCRICGTVNRIISKEKNVAVSGSSLNKQSKTMGMHLESSVAVPESIKSESSQQVIGSEKKSVIHSKAEVQMSTPGRTDSPGMQLDIKRQRLDSITSNNSSSVLENNNTNSGVENLSSSMESSTLENEDLEVPFPKRVKTELVDYQREFRTEASLVKSSSISVNKNPSDPATVKNKKVIEHSKIPFQASVASDDGVCHNSIEGNEQSDISSNKDVSGKFTEKEKDSLVKEKISKNMACHKSSSSSKTGKPKIQGVSLTEIFTLKQIQEHLQSLQQWVGQRKRNAEKLQAMRVNKSLNSCSLCAVERLSFEPPLIYCSACANCIKRSSQFYATGSGDARINICRICYNAIKGDSIKIDGIIIQKCNMEKRKNDEEAEEAWVQCDHCQSWQHQICALFNSRMNECSQAEYSCPSCYGEQVRNGERLPLPENAILGAKDLPKTVLSDYIEERLFRKLKLEREERANASSKSYNEVPGVDDLVVRVVSSVDKKVEVKTHFLEIFRNAGYPTEYPYRSKAILLFQKIEGVEVCLFSMYVQEYGTDAPYPNQRHVYLAYLDSVKYFRPDIKTVCGEALRTFVYHEILIGYLEFCKKRGFASCYIWACPPLKGEDYILYCHPEIQKTPRTDKLREWYHTMIRKASKEKIVADMTNLYDFFFSEENENKAKVTAARLPYFDGDYWPGAAEDILNKIPQANDKTNQHKIKKDVTKRALKNFSLSEPSNSNSMDSLLMDKLGDIIKPTKGDFILAHLQPTCAHCRLFIMSGSQWVCGQCRKFQLCDKCYDAELKLDDKSRHPTNSREKHMLSHHEVVDTAMDTRDLDELLESEIFDTRQAFLSLCQGNHYQYDTLRRAKHSSMMILYHLHNPTAPAFVITCIICNQEVDTGKGWRCEICPDFDMCNACYQKNGNSKHPHKLSTHHSGSGQDASTREIRKKKSLLIRKNLEVLIHASRCTQCKHPICKKIKAMFRHGSICKVRGQGGCVICKWMWTLLQMHARSCKDSQCRVPRCTDLKDHFQRLQFQSESRRRAAYNEKMRQRALEITEQN